MYTILLPARCDRSAAITLYPELRDRLAEGEVVIDGSDVTQLGQAMLQLLLSARQTATRHGQALSIILSDKMRSTLAMAEANPDMLAGIGKQP